MSGRRAADDSGDGESLPTMSQAVSASQVQSRRAAAATNKADGRTKGQSDVTEAYRAIWVRKEMIKVPPMKMKFDLHMTKGQTSPRDEDTVVQRQQSLMANTPNRPLSCFFILAGRRCVPHGPLVDISVQNALQRVL